MKITSMRANHLETPLGYDLSHLSLSWIAEETRGTRQTAARVQIALDPGFSRLLHDSGPDANPDSLSYCPGLTLSPRTRYYWKVTVCDETGDEGSAVSWFETGKCGEPWQAEWISPDCGDVHPLVRGVFSLPERPVRARAYACGLGLYELFANGERVGDEYFTPYYNDYHLWMQVQTYDVTHLLHEGENVLGAMLGNGWYKGRFGFEAKQRHGLFGDRYSFLCEVRVTLESGRELCFGTDGSWKWAPSPVLESSIYDGEVYDARLAIPGWNRDPQEPAGFRPVSRGELSYAMLSDRFSVPVRVTETLPAPQLIRTPKGENVLDFRQEITGWVRFACSLPAGTRVHLQYGEILQDDCFYNDNLRSAKAEYTYISDGSPAETRPFFTFYGFRYVKVEGMEEVNPADFTACVLHSDLETTGCVETSDPRVNRLFLNAMWGQRGNFLDVPTDCPQRDERMGWTGDAQVFCPTATFNMDTAAFYRKYLHDMLLEQRGLYHGSVPHVVPMMILDPDRTQHGSCAWADAAAVIPWQQYLFYGDKSLLAEEYENMRAWADYLQHEDQENGGEFLRTSGFHFADWLALDNPDKKSCFGGTDPYYVASAYYYGAIAKTARAARALGRTDEADRYAAWAENIRKAFRARYLLPGGDNVCKTQTSYVLALAFGLTPEDERGDTLRLLREKLRESNMHLTTGFCGTPCLCPVLSENGGNAEAYRLLLNDDYPSWLYEIGMGATTVWERWNSVLPDGSISDTGMNSLNHYAYGSIVEWMYRYMCGINPVEDAPGFRRTVLRPMPDKSLSFAHASFRSPAGLFESGWEYEDEGKTILYTFTVPFNAEAELWLPGDSEPVLLAAGTHSFRREA